MPDSAFGVHLRQFREAAALTREELAGRAGLTVKDPAESRRC